MAELRKMRFNLPTRRRRPILNSPRFTMGASEAACSYGKDKPMSPSVAVVGATGAVGEIMVVVRWRRLPLRSSKCLATERSAAKATEFQGKQVAVELLRPEAFAGLDIVLSSTPASISREYSPIAAKAGAIVIDNSSAWRMDP